MKNPFKRWRNDKAKARAEQQRKEAERYPQIIAPLPGQISEREHQRRQIDEQRERENQRKGNL